MLWATAAHAVSPNSTSSFTPADIPGFASGCPAKNIVPNPRESDGNLLFNSVSDGDGQLDPQIAVGGGFVMTASNTQLVVHQKTGAVVRAVDFSCFAKAQQGTIDPKLVYSREQQRFVLAGFQDPWTEANRRIKLSFSKTSDPTAGWLQLTINGVTDMVDGGNLGYSGDWVAYSYPTTNGGGAMVVVRWSDVYDGGTITVYRFVAQGIGQPVFTQHSRYADLYFVHNMSFTDFELNRLTTTSAGKPDYVAKMAQGKFPEALSQPTKAPQQGGSNISSGDWNPKVAVLRSGSIWFQGAVTKGPRSVIRWHEVDQNGKVRQSGTIADATPGVFNMQPTLAVNKQNDVLVGYTQSSAGTTPSPAFSYRRATDPVGTMPTTVKLANGAGPVTSTGAFGDYSGSSVDGDNDLDLWTIQSIGQGGTSSHGTLVARLQLLERFSDMSTYKHGNRVSLNGKNFTLNIRMNGIPDLASSVGGRVCPPDNNNYCSQATPHKISPSGPVAYWVPDPPFFKVTGIYKHDDRVRLNNTSFTLNVRINNNPHPLSIAGTQCAPDKCTRTKPYNTPSGIGAWWVPDPP
ncbi:MAG TPA: hypothetical protein VNO30_41045 [Kofleriaceae bacterium]|nr:hypothetical protein [Kofleriaceae bacterium]